MASMSKRAQARAEKELQDLLRVPGNSTCADCGARNPSWASWNLGIFLCMRCASIHRKLGTHISKVKSLSMDTWTNDQVETMVKNGNAAVNKVYNPKNKRPDMPLDADEVDGAMERFIRKKYQEKSLSDGRPEVPSRDEMPLPRSKSPDMSPPPTLPSKKGRFFGFTLRSSSSAYPLSKHDKKHRNEARFDNSSRVTSEDYTSTSRTNSSRAEMSDYDLQVKLAQLRDMGFTDNERNTNTLKRHNGDVERTIAALVKLGPSEQPVPRRTTPTPTVSTARTTTPQTAVSAPQSAVSSLNPWQPTTQGGGFGISIGNTAPQATAPNANPWQSAISNQSGTGVEQAFSGLHVSQPLFPHSTGGYTTQPQYSAQPVSQQMAPTQQQYPSTSSPVSLNNPFMQAPLSAHSTGSNPYASHMQPMPGFAPSMNPFFNAQNNTTQQTNSPSQISNPFGLPPSNLSPQAQSNPFDGQSAYFGNTQASPYGGTQYAPQQQLSQPNGPQSPPLLPNFQQGQPQTQQYGQQQFGQQSTINSQSQYNSYVQQQSYSQQQPLPSPQQQQQQQQELLPSPQHQYQQQQPAMSPQPQHNPYFQQQSSPSLPQQPQQQNQPLMPQQTGHLDKKSILALYNYPQLAPGKALASIPEPINDQDSSQLNRTQQQVQSPAPSGDIYGGINNANAGKRSVTMPASSMHSAGGGGSRNPFMTSTNSNTSPAPMAQTQQFGMSLQGARHASHDSMVVNNQNLQDGRHSPDAFANLSARYMK